MEVQCSWEILLNWQTLERKQGISKVLKKFGLELAMAEEARQLVMPLALNLQEKAWVLLLPAMVKVLDEIEEYVGCVVGEYVEFVVVEYEE